MNDFLVDVPVAITIWVRPDLQKMQLEVLQKAKPSIIFIQSDGGRNDDEWRIIKNSRKMVEEGINWNCKVYKIYESENIGLYEMIPKLFSVVWSKVDRCIFLEDDHIPSISYFKLCEYLLEKYKNDERIEGICGFNNANVWDAGPYDYFFSRRGSIWGFATWKNRLLGQQISDYSSDSYYLRCAKNIEKNDHLLYDAIKGYIKNDHYNGHIPGDEFWHRFNLWSFHRLFIIISKNMISCRGATSNSTHACDYDILPDYLKPLFNSRTYEISFPLTEPKYVICDEEYALFVEKSRGELNKQNKDPIFRRFRRSIKREGLIKTCVKALKNIFGKAN